MGDLEQTSQFISVNTGTVDSLFSNWLMWLAQGYVPRLTMADTERDRERAASCSYKPHSTDNDLWYAISVVGYEQYLLGYDRLVVVWPAIPNVLPLIAHG